MVAGIMLACTLGVVSVVVILLGDGPTVCDEKTSVWEVATERDGRDVEVGW